MKSRLIRVLVPKLQLRYSSSEIKAVPELDESVKRRIETGGLNPRHHPGALRKKMYELPESLKRSYLKVIGDVPRKQLLKEVEDLAPYLHSRLVPVEDVDVKRKKDEITAEVISSINADWDNLNEEEEDRYGKIIRDKVTTQIKQKCYNWAPLPFNRHLGLQYMTLRLAPEFAVVFQILSELSKTENYAPRNLFDFGCGIGTVLWAAHELWGESIEEYFCVDTSVEMNELTKEIAGMVFNEKTVQRIFHRQFLPSSSDRKYDIVISAYSLIELPSGVTRLETVLNLWNKTNDYLILIERGTMAGFKLVNQAKDFILEKEAKYRKNAVHVNSPCPHETECPRLRESQSPCNFPAVYMPFPQRAVGARRELYSYVILAKRPRPSHSTPPWPRIVRPVLVRTRHTFCRMCTSDGKIEEVVVTPNRHGKLTHRITRMSKWGDSLPVTLRRDVSVSDELDQCNGKKV